MSSWAYPVHLQITVFFPGFVSSWYDCLLSSSGIICICLLLLLSSPMIGVDLSSALSMQCCSNWFLRALSSQLNCYLLSELVAWTLDMLDQSCGLRIFVGLFGTYNILPIIRSHSLELSSVTMLFIILYPLTFTFPSTHLIHIFLAFLILSTNSSFDLHIWKVVPVSITNWFEWSSKLKSVGYNYLLICFWCKWQHNITLKHKGHSIHRIYN